MDTRLVAAAIPLFGIFIALEWWISNKRKVKVYRLFDAIADLSCGISQQLCLLVSQAPLLVLYAYVQQNYAIWTFEQSLTNFALAVQHQAFAEAGAASFWSDDDRFKVRAGGMAE